MFMEDGVGGFWVINMRAVPMLAGQRWASAVAESSETPGVFVYIKAQAHGNHLTCHNTCLESIKRPYGEKEFLM